MNIVKTHFEELFAKHIRYRKVLEEARMEKRQSLYDADDDDEWAESTQEQKGAMKMDELGKRRKGVRQESGEKQEEKNGYDGEKGEEEPHTTTTIEDASSDDEVVGNEELIKKYHEEMMMKNANSNGAEDDNETLEQVKKPYEQTVSDGELYILGRRRATVDSVSHLRSQSVNGRGSDAEAGGDLESGQHINNEKEKKKKFTTSSRHIKVKRRSSTQPVSILTSVEDKQKDGLSKAELGSSASWTDIDLLKNQEEVDKEKKLHRQREKLLYKEIDAGVVSVNAVPELKDVIYYSDMYKDACNKLAHYKELRRTNGFRPRLSCPPGLPPLGFPYSILIIFSPRS